MPRQRVKPLTFSIYTGNDLVSTYAEYSRTERNYCRIRIIEEGEEITCYRITSTEFESAYNYYILNNT